MRRDPMCRDPFGRGCVKVTEQIDHVVPKDAGGTDSEENLWGLCKGDHTRKTLLEQTVTFVHDCECDIKTLFWQDADDKRKLHLSCDDHAISEALAINKWPQVVCYQ
jgi:hypothetical protein